MSIKTMLYALTKVNQWQTSPAGKAAKVPQELLETVAEALVAGTGMVSKMGRPQGSTGHPGGKGRPPSSAYIVEISNYAPMRVLGGQAAVDIVNKEMEEMGDRYRLNLNNMTTTISTKGEWWRNVDTGNGVVTVSVQREKAPKKSA